jgi:hypothetical protein
MRPYTLFLLCAALLGAQDFGHLQIEPIANGFAGGEGPVWSRQGFLLFSDYEANRIYKYIPGKSPEVYREGSNGANGNTMDRQGRLYTCEYRSRRVTRTDRTGRIEVLAERFESGSTRRMTSWSGGTGTSISATPCIHRSTTAISISSGFTI